MMAGLGVVGQSSSASGTPSTSMSSFLVAHEPLFVTDRLSQLSPPQISPGPPAQAAPRVGQIVPERLQVKKQLHCWLLLLQVLLGSSLHTPLLGHWAADVQMVVLVRLQVPAARVTTAAPAQ